MRIACFCLLALLSRAPAAQGQPALAKESDEGLAKQVKALEQQIKALQGQIEELRKQQAPLLAEQAARAEKRWEAEARTHSARAEVRGRLRKSKAAIPLPFAPAIAGGWASAGWQVVVNGQSWEVRFPEKDRAMQAAAEKLLGKQVVVTGAAGFWARQEPLFPSSSPSGYGPYGPFPGYGYRYPPPPTYLFSVHAESLRPAPLTPTDAEGKKLQKHIEAVRARINLLNRKGDDITRRESVELVGLEHTLKKLSKELSTRLHFAKVRFRGKLVSAGPGAWQIQVGAFGAWNLEMGDREALKALARTLTDRRVVITGTVTADTSASPAVKVESLRSAGE